MQHKILINHCVAVLGQHHDFAQTPSSITVSYTSEPIETITNIHKIVDEDDILQSYFKTQNITNEPDQTFIDEVVKGCVRWKKILRCSLEIFFVKTGCRYLRQDYNFFAVFFYLAIVRVQDLSFRELAKFVRCFDAPKMHRMLRFLFCAKNLSGFLASQWNVIMDHVYVNENFIAPMLACMPEAQVLLAELKFKVEIGANPDKDRKKSTEFKPFLLTTPRPRKFIQPPIKISTVVKARAIPESMYNGNEEQEELIKKKATNKMMQQERHAKAESKQFKIVQKPSLSSSTLLRMERLKAEKTVQETFTRPKLRPVPASINESIPVKLTTAAILREDALIRKQKEVYEKMLLEAEIGLKDETEFQRWREDRKVKDEDQKRMELEKRRLEIQIMHEEAIAAKKEILKENKYIVMGVKVKKEKFKEQAEEAKKVQKEENKRRIQEVQEITENIKLVKAKISTENKQKAFEMQAENEVRKVRATREAEEELARKAELIRQIRLLEKAIPPVGSVNKIIDLTETSGLGLLGEMSVVELQERVAILKVHQAEDESIRRALIQQQKQTKLDIIHTKLSEIEQQRAGRRTRKEMNSASSLISSSSLSSMLSLGMTRSATADTSVRVGLLQETLDRDPALIELRERLRVKREARMSKASSIDMPVSSNSNIQKRASVSFVALLASADDFSLKWDDLEIAGKEHSHHFAKSKRDLAL